MEGDYAECWFYIFMQSVFKTGQNLGQIIKCSWEYTYAKYLLCTLPIQPSLELKTRPEQFLDSLPLNRQDTFSVKVKVQIS
jgi:hypothetical protein